MLKSLFILFISLSLASCNKEHTYPDTLIVVTRNAPTTWYQGRDGPQGPEYDLIMSFSRFINVPVKIEVVAGISEVLLHIKQNKAHIAAAGLTNTHERRDQNILFGPEYNQVQQQVVCRRSQNAVPKSIDELVGKNIHVIANSSYVERLTELKKEHADLTWTEVDTMDTEQLLKAVWQKNIDCTIADSNIVSINRRYYPELVVAFPLTETQSLAWVINKNWRFLANDIEDWLEHAEASGELAAIDEKYYGHIDLFDFVDMRAFNRRIKSRLPKYKALFDEASKKYNLDPSLLAAQAYQESHWNPNAKSPTGVRGMMMLTRNTAKEMGVTNRIDAAQSIEGGAKYLAKMIKRIPKEVTGENRIWFALAAYNIGFGHLRDARILAEKLGKDKNSWLDLKQVLPLLAQKKHYKTLKYGYARGSEAKSYVQRIRNYQQILNQAE